MKRAGLLRHLEVDLPGAVVLAEGFAYHLGEGLQGQGPKDRVLDRHAELGLQELRFIAGRVLSGAPFQGMHHDADIPVVLHAFSPRRRRGRPPQSDAAPPSSR